MGADGRLFVLYDYENGRICQLINRGKEIFIVTIDSIFLLFKNILKYSCIKNACMI